MVLGTSAPIAGGSRRGRASLSALARRVFDGLHAMVGRGDVGARGHDSMILEQPRIVICDQGIEGARQLGRAGRGVARDRALVAACLEVIAQAIADGVIRDLKVCSPNVLVEEHEHD